MSSSQPPSIQELKRTLVAAGLEIYRTRPDAVHLAERPRDNQILDAGISVRPAGEREIEVRVVMRAQRSDFPRDPIDTLYQRVREHAEGDLLARGFTEIETREQRMLDPGDKTKTLDTWYELVFSRTFADLESAIADVKRVLPVEKFVKGPGQP
ncbi:MAG: hypothetical protein HYV09_36580 [Deltaproteobacteria bacterium]|nr:hypothetical protein [Deltaproteobacteria bacterium]